MRARPATARDPVIPVPGASVRERPDGVRALTGMATVARWPLVRRGRSGEGTGSARAGRTRGKSVGVGCARWRTGASRRRADSGGVPVPIPGGAWHEEAKRHGLGPSLAGMSRTAGFWRCAERAGRGQGVGPGGCEGTDREWSCLTRGAGSRRPAKWHFRCPCADRPAAGTGTAGQVLAERRSRMSGTGVARNARAEATASRDAHVRTVSGGWEERPCPFG